MLNMWQSGRETLKQALMPRRNKRFDFVQQLTLLASLEDGVDVVGQLVNVARLRV